MKRDVRREAVAFTKQIFAGFGDKATVVQEMVCGCAEYGDGDDTPQDRLNQMSKDDLCLGWSGTSDMVTGVAMIEAIHTGDIWINAKEWFAEQAANGFELEEVRLVQMEPDIFPGWEGIAEIKPVVRVIRDYEGYFEALVRKLVDTKAEPFKNKEIWVNSGPWRTDACVTRRIAEGVIELDFYSALRTGFGSLTKADKESIQAKL